MLVQLFWDTVVLAGSVTAFWGWLKHQSVLCVVIGTVICLIDTALRWKDLNRNARRMDFFVFVIGLIVGSYVKNTPSPFICGMLAINAYSILIQAMTLLFRAVTFFFALTSCTDDIKAWLSKQKSILIFLSLILAVVLVVKLLDAEFARGRASGLEYAKEEFVSAAYNRGYEDGKSDTLDEHSSDYDNGYDVGYENAVSELEYEYAGKMDDVYDTAYNEGYEAGYEDGSGEIPVTVYSGGYSEDEIYRKAYSHAEDQLRHEYEGAIADAYEQGYEEGVADGASFDYNAAWTDGYNYGYKSGMSNASS